MTPRCAYLWGQFSAMCGTPLAACPFAGSARVWWRLGHQDWLAAMWRPMQPVREPEVIECEGYMRSGRARIGL